ncbi:DUF327 family protein [Chryseomicrobium palamuruense]|uniref:DUF327 family protein n=1 Tax=Chryseomicrobium palamuruense TaxID=682973 RepID=A0ABV8UXE0_9BACL
MMKVQAGFIPPTPKTDIRKMDTTPAMSFQRLLSSKDKQLSENHLDSLFEQLDNCGKHLTEWKTMDAFYRYKRAVKDVLSELASGYQLVENSSLMTGSTHQTVQIVEVKLLELQQKLLQDEVHHLEILDLIGELKGILVDRRG